MERFKAHSISTMVGWKLYHFIAIADTITLILYNTLKCIQSSRRGRHFSF